MALKPCKECKEQISTDVNVCPRCGKKAPHGPSPRRMLTLAVMLVVGVAMCRGLGSSDQSVASRLTHGATPTSGRGTASAPRAASQASSARVVSLQERIAAARAHIARGLALAGEKTTPENVLGWRDRVSQVRSAIGGIQADVLDAVGKDVKKALLALDRAEKRAQSKIDRAERQQAEAAALAVSCGTKPALDSWDGALVGAESYIAQTANDPGSLVQVTSKPLAFGAGQHPR